MLKHDDAMGGCRVNLRELSRGQTLDFVEGLSTQGGLAFCVSWELVAPYELRPGKMHVQVCCATDLLAADSNGLSDPYCKLTWLGQKGRTKIVPKSLNPEWDESFIFPGVLHELLSCPLRLRLYDHDRLSRDDPLGEVRVSLRPHLTSDGVLDVQLTAPLDLPDQGKNPHKVSSSITLHVTWSEKQGTAAAQAEAEAARDEASDVILLHGQLRQRGKMGTWSQRWVELTGHELVFFHSQEDPAPSGVLPLAHVLAAAEGATPSSIMLLLVPPTSSRSRGPNATSSSTHAPTAAKQRRLELQTIDGAVDGAISDARLQRVRWMRAIRLLIGQDVDPLAKFLDPSARRLSSTRCSGGGAGGGVGGGAGGGAGLEFGVPLADLAIAEGSFVGREVPMTLLMLWAELSARTKDGLELEGIFRLSADSSEVAAVKKRLHQAPSVEVATAACHAASGYCLAALIKTFLRDLPDDLWGASRPALDAAVAEAMAGRGTEEPGELLRQLPARSASLFAWCCDACAAVVAHEADNSMNVTAVATVMAPGLVRAPPNEQALLRVGVGLVVGLGDGAGCSSVYSAICGTCECVCTCNAHAMHMQCTCRIRWRCSTTRRRRWRGWRGCCSTESVMEARPLPAAAWPAAAARLAAAAVPASNLRRRLS